MYKTIKEEGLEKWEINEYGEVRLKRTKLIKKQQKQKGYCVVSFETKGIKVKRRVHRLVAETFLDKSNYKSMEGEIVDNLETLEVNHKDLNKENNHKSNLEWCTQAYNNYHAYKNSKLYERKKPVIRTNIMTGEEKYYDSLHQAGKDISKIKSQKDIDHKSTCISHACKKGGKSYGYKWRFVE